VASCAPRCAWFKLPDIKRLMIGERSQDGQGHMIQLV
jgi:hypothetical protein